MSFTLRRRRTFVFAAAGGLALAAVASPVGASATHALPVHHFGSGHGHLSITSVPWGTADGQPVDLFTLTNDNGMMVKISNYGGVVQSIWVPDRSHHLVNVALGFANLDDYVNDFEHQPWPLSGGSGDTYFGAIIGRYANRIANASFTLNGTTYTLPANNGPNTLHGGPDSYNTQVWSAAPTTGPGYVALRLSYTDPDGKNGFPGTVHNTVTYTLTDANALVITYEATTTAPTVVNFTNHTYFNLAGEGSGSVFDQYLQINADSYLPTDNVLIPTGAFVPVAGTPFDFRTLHRIGDMIRRTDLPDGGGQAYQELQMAHGYDFNWVINGAGYRLAATAFAPSTGIALWTFTDQPGIQFYSGNFLVGDLIGTSGRAYRQTDGFTLETQHYPDSPHHIGQPGWPSVVLNPGETFRSTTTYQFGVESPAFVHHPQGPVHPQFP
ncbi:MAG: galactose mutarotase [Acidothermus cellulolyticus]|nr:galactose mutarotase [Acidothermus cellulolyticus]